MSIAVTATQKFDFQDLVCVEMMLRFHHLRDAQFLVEPDGGEDGELLFGTFAPGARAEIQVKGAAGSVTLGTIATCLAHSSPREASDTLLERLLADPGRIVVLVMSGRCDDAASVYAASPDWLGPMHAEGAIKVADASALLAAFATAELPGKEGGALKTKRQQHCRAVAAATKPDVLRAALRRLIILERLGDVELETRCANRLRTAHRIPGDRITDVLGRLRSAVKAAKAQREDAFPLVRAVLKDAVPPPIRPHDYVLRDEETSWVADLSHNRVLLLSGPPRVGKTDAARWVAAEFEPHGYEIRELTDVDTAERFLLEPGDALRLAILDDPLGGTHAVPDPGRALFRIGTLIPRLAQGRKLIVAQAQDRLLAVSRKVELSEVLTGGHAWRDLGTVSKAFLGRLWRQLAQNWNVAESLRETVGQALENGALQLEAGCLRHLAVHHARLNGACDLEQIVRLAREDAASLGYALAEDGFEPLLTAIALASSASESISLTELAYVNGAGGDGLPGKSKNEGAIIVLGDEPEDTTHPVYDIPPHLASEDEARLDSLERRRMIEVGSNQVVAFTHPFYRSAAEALLESPTRQAAAKATTKVKRGLFCLAPATSRATARNLDWVFERLAQRQDARDALIDHAIAGLSSYFPSTRDLCFRFLVQRLAALPRAKRAELPRWVSAVTSVSLDDLEWVNGEARLPIGETRGLLNMEQIFIIVSAEEVANELAILDSADDGYLSPQRAAKVLFFYADNPSAISSRAVGRLLSYDEAAIRAAVVETWLKLPRTDDGGVLQRIFGEEHPSIAIAALRGAISGWHLWSSERQRLVLDGLKGLAGSSAAAAALVDHLVRFGRVEFTGEDTPWPIFEALLPVVMRVLPENAGFIDARLFEVARTACSVLPAQSMVDICDGWVEWLERKTSEGRLPSEFSLGVADILICATVREPTLRAGRVQRLLAFPGTGVLFPFIADLVDNWEDLTDLERLALEETVTGRRPDVRWLQAVVLTRSTVPLSLERRILGMAVSLNDGAESLLRHMPPELLEAAVHVYSGRPQPLWWLGTHHAGKAVWEPVIDKIAATAEHPLFELAWEHIAYTMKDARMAASVKAVGAQHADRMFELMLRIKVAWEGNFMPEAWAALLALAPNPETYSRWIGRMTEFAPAILDRLPELKHWLAEAHLDAMVKALATDVVPRHFLHQTLELYDGSVPQEIKDRTVDFLLLAFKRMPPRLFGTCDDILACLRALHIEVPDLLAEIGKRRKVILEDRKRLENTLKTEERPLASWIAP